MDLATTNPLVIETGGSFHELYPRLLSDVIQRGSPAAPRHQETYEISPLLFVLENPSDCIKLQKSRGINYAYAIIEKLSLIFGEADPNTFRFYIPALDSLLNEEGAFGGAYGPRLTGQLGYIYELLKDDPESRRAVMTVYTAPHDQQPGKDIPCTISLQFLLRGGRLNMITNMRSSDIYLGLPYDVQQFTFLQRLMALWLDVDLGNYTHIAGSGHVYLKDLDVAKKVIDEPDHLNSEAEPPVDLTYQQARPQVRAFFIAEKELRHGDVREPAAASTYAELGPYLRSCLRKVSRFINKKARTTASLRPTPTI